MYGWIYHIFSTFAVSLLPALKPFSGKIKNLLKERENVQEPAPGQRKYWIHCASLGEFEMAIPLIEKLLEKNKLNEILISFFSPSGYRNAIRGPYAAAMIYLPFDSRKNVKRFYKKYNPQNAIFIRYELWYNYLKLGIDSGMTFYLVNARFGSKHALFAIGSKAYLDLLKKFKTVYVSDKQTEENLINKGLSNVIFSGDTRYDRILDRKNQAPLYEKIERFKTNKPLLIIGSSWPPEEDIAQKLLQRTGDKLKLIIAPHDISPERINELKQKFEKYKLSCWTSRVNFDDNILIIDCIGLLSAIYRYADFALVGGGFSGKLHNVLEPLVWGVHISFGPKVDKFPEAGDLLRAGLAYRISDQKSWLLDMEKMIIDNEKANERKANAELWVMNNAGATNLIIQSLN